MTNEIMSTDQPTPLAQMQKAKAIAKEIAATVGHLIVNIQGRQYPTVAWWQAVGWAFNVTSTEVEVTKQATGEDGSVEYMAVVAIVRIDTGETVSRGSAIASSAERAPWGRSAFSVRSMAITRATGRAYRHGCAIIPHLLKIESTPAEEMPIESAQPEARALPAAAPASSGSSSVMAMLKQSVLDEQIDGLAGQVSEIAKELGHKISPASARAAAEKGSTSQEDVRDRLVAKVATGHSKLSEKKASKK
jgi:hypothetical protein